MTSLPWPAIDGLAYGGDYTPEQWPREVWREDAALMREAGVNLVSVGIFSWALLETSEGVFDFAWLDELLDLLHENGVSVDLGTPTASPPAWFFANHPDARVIDRNGVVQGFGARGMASHSSPVFREAIVRIASALAERYAQHPAVVMWHVHNEYGVPVGEDYSPQSVAAFRKWLRARYGTLDALNAAWGTTFWGQRYGEWDHIGAPAAAPSVVNPAQRLDFARFTDHQLRDCFIAERDAIRAHSSLPVTTNFMANQSWTTDMWAWAREVDIVSDDHYLWAADPEGEIGLAIAADLTRSVGGGKPWILMEHSTSAVNWQPRNIAKRPGEMARNSFTHLGRGADAIMFFQWRASRSGAEKFHSAMVPHAGTTSRVWREVVELGGALQRVAGVRGSTVQPEVAILWDFESFWAQDLEWRPSEDITHADQIRAFYEQLWRDGVAVDFALPGHDLSKYKLVVAPAQYLLSTKDAANLTRYVEAGGTLLVSFFSAIVDENDAVHPGGFVAPLRDALGLTVEEFLPLRDGDGVTVSWTGAAGDDPHALSADAWAEDIALEGADVVATYVDGPGADKPAITRNTHGEGTGWYVSTRLDAAGLSTLLGAVYADAGVELPGHPEGLEVMVRHGEDARYVIAVNHRDTPAQLAGSGEEILGGTVVDGSVTVEPGGVAVLRTPIADTQGGGRSTGGNP
ncbi:beta-galactosidase [Microbacterium terrae]|uniref:Beta-galactosidase n=1 Tax=Microbacterium terrae TaxID=69369 RepID=A0A0M2H5V8_9MICO|nr:beta-galactosidase [Microbacterium terrae]KJL39230.1 Beta-galactosidase bgaB [Microbacterium terrae]MBP1076836.1 beta-galactosidase [Microbacterium terrae]GLJ99431.1 beta-galactosidase [Microbacterium terrae]